jgi:hypothetical protein
MIEQVPWLRVRPDGTDVGDAVVQGTVKIDPAGHVMVREAGRVVAGQGVGQLTLRQPRLESGLVSDFDAASLQVEDCVLGLTVSSVPGEVTVGRADGKRLAAFTVSADTARFSADVTVGGKVNGRDIAADGTKLDNHVARTDNPHKVNAAQVGALPTSGGTIAGALQLKGLLTTGGGPLTRIPTGWGGGVHTWDVYSEGTIGSGQNGAVNAFLRNDGAVVGRSKSFIIDHPLRPYEATLVHACIEGPEHAVYYRGEAKLVEGEATVELPDYFEALTCAEGRTVQLTPILDGDGPIALLAASRVVDGRFRVRAASASVQAFYWEVKAVRADVPRLTVEQPRDIAVSMGVKEVQKP